MASLGIPLVPGSDGAVPDLETAQGGRRAAIGYPVLIKAAAGGGGRGMKVARDAGELPDAFRTARAESQAAFGNDAVYIEKYLDRPRDISSCRSWPTRMAPSCISESGIAVCNAATRNCWRRPVPPRSDPEQRAALGRTATDALRKLGYRNAGTLEFLYQDGQFAFIEMNTHSAGRASGDGDGLRPRPRAGANPDRRRRQVSATRSPTSSFSGHAIECQGHGRRSGDIRPFSRTGHGVSCARRTGRAGRLRPVRGLPSCLLFTTAWSPS